MDSCGKKTDDLSAKIEIWARNPRVHAIPRITNLPKFPPQRFSSYEEMNSFKRWLIAELARQGGATWSW